MIIRHKIFLGRNRLRKVVQKSISLKFDAAAVGNPVVCYALYLIKCYSRGETRRLNIQRASDGLARERKMPVLAAHIFPEMLRGVALIFFPAFFPPPRPVVQPQIFSRTHALAEPGKIREKNTRPS